MTTAQNTNLNNWAGTGTIGPAHCLTAYHSDKEVFDLHSGLIYLLGASFFIMLSLDAVYTVFIEQTSKYTPLISEKDSDASRLQSQEGYSLFFLLLA